MYYFDRETGEKLTLDSNWKKDRYGKDFAWFRAKSGAVFTMYASDVNTQEALNRQIQLRYQITNRIKAEHNAACPKCCSTWEVDFDTNWYDLEPEQRNHILKEGYLHIICEDCEHDEDIEEFLDLLHEWNIQYESVCWEDMD